MNPVAEEILSYFGTIDSLSDEELMHYGIKRRSGRYPYGSGENPYQHGRDFLARISELKQQNFTFTDENGKTWTGDNAIAKSMGLTTSDYRKQVSWATYERRLDDVARAKSLRSDGLGYTEIGRQMGINESSVRSLLDSGAEGRMHETMKTVDSLREIVNEKKMVDVGPGVELELRISKERLNNALDYLQKAEGYEVYSGRIPQPTNKGQSTTQRVLCVPGTKHSEIYDFDKVQTIKDYISRDGGTTLEKKFNYPASLDSKRLQIRYDEDGGTLKDGIIELRRGVADLSLGESRYSQVRILVDGDRYLKGMAVYSDNMPDGVDVIFNTNKHKGTDMRDVLKKIKDDPDNPFGSTIKDADQGGQYFYNSKTGERCSSKDPNAKLGLINKRADEGDWSDWKDALPSQFLGKQSLSLAKKQLNLDKANKIDEYDAICKLENPTIKKHLLEKFADGCDSAAVHLQAASLPGQKYHVIIPVNSLKENEIYAPNYENGTQLALIRYPHGGTFEIPILTVNNKHKPARDLLGTDIQDAVGITSKVAERLSGADFDGDTVMCIPTNDSGGKVKIISKPALKGLEGFDPKASYSYDKKTVDDDGTEHYYRGDHEFKVMKNKGTEMGKISNLITDMTLGGAKEDELARAVRHSMVVIDAEKHKLDYKASEVENNIKALRDKYQRKVDPETGEIIVGKSGGASTILSRAKGETSTTKRQGSYKVNMPGTPDYDPTRPDGAKLWKAADDLYYPDKTYNKNTGLMTVRTADGGKITYNVKDKTEYEKYNPVKRIDDTTGKVKYTNQDGDIEYRIKERTQQTTKMEATDDAMTLVSDKRHPMELVYADYANSMKSLGNRARVEMKNTGKITYSSEAARTYKAEVDSLMSKLNNAELNAIRERAAIRKANTEIKSKLDSDPDMKGEDRKKISQQALSKAREEVQSVSRRDRNIDITDKEWEAIQAGAISESKLVRILNNSDIDKLRERATPHVTNSLSKAQINRIKAMSASNYTLAEIAQKMGVSSSTVSKYLKGGK